MLATQTPSRKVGEQVAHVSDNPRIPPHPVAIDPEVVEMLKGYVKKQEKADARHERESQIAESTLRSVNRVLSVAEDLKKEVAELRVFNSENRSELKILRHQQREHDHRIALVERSVADHSDRIDALEAIRRAAMASPSIIPPGVELKKSDTSGAYHVQPEILASIGEKVNALYEQAERDRQEIAALKAQQAKEEIEKQAAEKALEKERAKSKRLREWIMFAVAIAALVGGFGAWVLRSFALKP